MASTVKTGFADIDSKASVMELAEDFVEVIFI